MSKINQPCSRCGKAIDGEINGTFTAGFYLVNQNSGWAQFARTGEWIICDCCMWSDPAYIVVYGEQNMEGCS